MHTDVRGRRAVKREQGEWAPFVPIAFVLSGSIAIILTIYPASPFPYVPPWAPAVRRVYFEDRDFSVLHAHCLPHNLVSISLFWMEGTQRVIKTVTKFGILCVKFYSDLLWTPLAMSSSLIPWSFHSAPAGQNIWELFLILSCYSFPHLCDFQPLETHGTDLITLQVFEVKALCLWGVSFLRTKHLQFLWPFSFKGFYSFL